MLTLAVWALHFADQKLVSKRWLIGAARLAIFLHFLNREAYRAVGSQYSLKAAEISLRVLASTRSDSLFTNFANLLEGDCLSSGLVAGLLANGQMLLEGERPSLIEFIETRAERYAFDASRYPMYFARTRPPNLNLQPHLIRSTSLTDHIQAEILHVANHSKGMRDIGVGPGDVSIVSRALPVLAKAVQERGDRAITRSLFAERIAEEATLASASRLISATYIARHKTDLRADIATGVDGLVAFDHLAACRWRSNVRLLRLLAETVGFRGALSLTKNVADGLLVELRNSSAQAQISDLFRLICGSLSRCFPGSTFEVERDAVLSILAPARYAEYPEVGCSVDLFEKAFLSAHKMLALLRNAHPTFALAYEEEAMNQGKKVLLLVTATKVESQSLAGVMKDILGMSPVFIRKDQYIASDFGEYSGLRVVHVQCEAGSGGPSGSQAVINDAISDFDPTAIVMGGIAFGVDRTKQKLGDVLVSKMLAEYERAKLKEGEEIPRGQRIESSPKLLSTFRAAEAGNLLTEADVKFGLMLSGEKLVDSRSFLKARLEQEPEAIGGEMEGAGLAAIATRRNVPWIVVKAIVDWGADKEGNNTPEHQRAMANNAFLFIVRTLQKIGF